MRRRLLWTAVAVLSLLAATSPRAQVPVFVASRDVVRLDVLVSERGRPVAGLKAGDFIVLDNGVPQQVDYLSFDELPLNVVLTFDVSGSMAGRRFEDLRAAGHALLDQLRPDDRAAFLSFGHALSLGADLTTDMAAVRAAVNRASARGQTSLVDASFTGLALGGSDAGRSLMLVFSDGVDTSSWLEPRAVIDAARRANVVVFGVAVGRSRTAFLKDLVDVTGGDLVEVQSTPELRSTFVRLLAEYRQRYIVGYSPSGVTPAGWHKVAVTVSRRGATVKAREGYQGR